MGDEAEQLVVEPVVEQEMQPLVGGHLPGLVLRLDLFRAAAQVDRAAFFSRRTWSFSTDTVCVRLNASVYGWACFPAADLRQHAVGRLRMEERDLQPLRPCRRFCRSAASPSPSRRARRSVQVGTAKAIWCTPSPRFSMNFPIGPSGAVDSRSSILVCPSLKKAVLTFWSATSSMA